MWGKARGESKSIEDLDLLAVMASAVFSFVLHHYSLQWCKVNVKRPLADGCLLFMKGYVCTDIFLFPFSSYDLSTFTRETGRSKNTQETETLTLGSPLNFCFGG